MNIFSPGDRVRIDIPDKSDPDHARYHGRHGEVVKLIEDDASLVRGDDRDSVVYRIQLDDGEQIDLRWRDIRPP